MLSDTTAGVRCAPCALLLALPFAAVAADYRCTVERKVDSDREYTAAQLKAGQFSNLVEETKNGTFVSRCSYAASEGRVTCERYRVDRVEVDPAVKLKKLYVFRSQLNVQLFRDMSFIEDNGRGSISFGRCQVTAP